MFVKCDDCINKREDGYCAIPYCEPFTGLEYYIPCPEGRINCGNHVEKEGE